MCVTEEEFDLFSHTETHGWYSPLKWLTFLLGHMCHVHVTLKSYTSVFLLSILQGPSDGF